MAGFRQVTKAQARSHLSHDERMARLEGAVLPYATREQYVEEIGRLWKDAQNAFLTIGRYLVAAADKLEHGEFQAMVENELPFGYQVAYQLRKVAEAIDGGRLPVAELPNSYATIYQLTTLSEDQLLLAGQRCLIRPDVKRQEIITFKREIARETRQILTPKRLEQLQRLRENLVKQRDAILLQLEQVDCELGSGNISE